MPEQKVWTWKQLLDANLGKSVAWVTPSVADRIPLDTPFSRAPSNTPLPLDLDTLVIIGGGKLIDRAKAAVSDGDREIQLIAVPTIWGSGAESSPIIVLDREGKKEIRVDAKHVPNVRVVWPEIANSISADQARWACGDVWSHALEGFLSPLAQDDVSRDLQAVLREILILPITNDSRWFELSARACACQARAGVGLVHGIAHTLESALAIEQPDKTWGHARLCSVYLHPVMEFNRAHSDKWQNKAEKYGIDPKAVDLKLLELFDPQSYTATLTLLERHWKDILRDPCTRMNSTLVRPSHLSFFLEGKFS